jgi:hypothetical protein
VGGADKLSRKRVIRDKSSGGSPQIVSKACDSGQIEWGSVKLSRKRVIRDKSSGGAVKLSRKRVIQDKTSGGSDRNVPQEGLVGQNECAKPSKCPTRRSCETKPVRTSIRLF